MNIDVEIPTLGESITEGVIVRWIKSDGEVVATDEPLFELEKDKASVEIPAPGAGVVHILKHEGTTVQVGEVVARIDADGAIRSKDGGKKAAGRQPAAKPEERAPSDAPPQKQATEPAPEAHLGLAAGRTARACSPLRIPPPAARLSTAPPVGAVATAGRRRGAPRRGSP